MNSDRARQVSSYAPERAQGEPTIGKVIGAGLGALAAMALLANLKDIIRYLKIANM